MIAARYEELKRKFLSGEAFDPPVSADELIEYDEIRAWEQRSNAAKQAVRTKRLKYTKWPTRKGDHRARTI